MTFVELSDAFRQGVHDDDTCGDLLGRVDDAAERVCEQDPAEVLSAQVEVQGEPG